MNAQMAHVPKEVARQEADLEALMRDLLCEDPDAHMRILKALDRATKAVTVEPLQRPPRKYLFELVIP
jgi:hypothetical protein